MSGTGQTSKDETADGDATARLFGMLVNEVSFVDRAANERTFLLLKRADPMATKITKDGAAPADAGAAAAPAPAGGAAPSAMQAQVKDQLLAAVTAAAEKLVALADLIKGAETSDQAVDPPVPEAVAGAIGEVAQMVQSLAAQYAGAGSGAAGAPAAAKDLDGITENGGVTAQGAQKDATGDVLAKAGRKMAKERMARFAKAIDLLAGIMKEISSDSLKKSAGGAAGSRVAPGMVQVPVETIKQVNQVLAEVAPLTANLKKANDSLASANAEIVRLRSATVPGHSMPTELAKSQPAAREVSWPLDLNRPIEPARVPTTKRFAGR